MNHKAEAYLKDIPTKPYDLIREGLIVLTLFTVTVFILAIFFSSPDYPAVRGVDVAKFQPLAYLKTSANILAGNSGIQDYGPPYSSGTTNTQEIFGIAPAAWLGVSDPINPPEDFILQPLAKVAVLNKNVAGALQIYKAAAPKQQQAWAQNYLAALNKASVINGQVEIPQGNYGPVSAMMNGMLNLGRAGLLEGALESNARTPFNMNFTRSLLFFQDDVDSNVASSLDMLGETWGVAHETGAYPGAWWLWSYSFLYQIPPMSTSPNGDLQAVLIITLLFLALLFMPFIPVLNRLPRRLKMYKLIWRDWYTRAPKP
jgi:hypothetical protein